MNNQKTKILLFQQKLFVTCLLFFSSLQLYANEEYLTPDSGFSKTYAGNLRQSAFKYGARPSGVNERHYIYKTLDPQLILRWDDFDNVADKALEGAFWVVENPTNTGPKYRGYTAQGDTYLWEGSRVTNLKFTGVPATNSDRVRRCINGVDYTANDYQSDSQSWDSLPIFNEGGAWLRSGYSVVDSLGNKIIRGWYHTEAMGCYTPSLPRHSISSMGYAESYDGGKTFVNKSTKPLLGISELPQVETFNGLAGATVIQSNSYLYMYFIGKDPVTRISEVRAARSLTSDPARVGIQGTWSKWHEGRFINAYEQSVYGEFSAIKTINADRFGNKNPGISPAYNTLGDTLLLAWPQEDGISYSEEFQPDGVSFRKSAAPFFLSEKRSQAVRRTIPIYRYYSDSANDYWMATSKKFLLGRTTPSASAGYHPDRTLIPTAFTGYMYQRAETYRGVSTVPMYHCQQTLSKNGTIVKDQIIRVPGIDEVGSNGCTSSDVFKFNPRVIGQLWPANVELSELPSDVVPLYRYYSMDKDSYLIGPEGLIERASENLVMDTLLGYVPTTEAGDLIRNVSIVGPEGGKEFEKEFYLFYTMLRRGDENYKRQYMRRKVVVKPVNSSREFYSLTSLAQYSSNDSNDFWATTTLPFSEYKWRGRLGFVYNRVDHNNPYLISLYDCVRTRSGGRLDHVLRAREAGCITGEKKLRRLGFIYKAGTPVNKRPATKPLYNCFDRDKLTYVASNVPSCGSDPANNAALIGYVSK